MLSAIYTEVVHGDAMLVLRQLNALSLHKYEDVETLKEIDKETFRVNTCYMYEEYLLDDIPKDTSSVEMEISFTEYDTIDEIVVPQDVLNKAIDFYEMTEEQETSPKVK